VTEDTNGQRPPDVEPGSGYGSPQGECLHKFVTGADGAVYCQKCGTVLYDSMFPASGPGPVTTAPEQKSTSYRWWLILAAAVVIALVAVLGWKYSTKRPEALASGEQASAIDLSKDPEQVDTAHKVLHVNADKVSISSLTTYRIWAKAICVRAYAGFDRGSTGFPIDLALAWGDVANSDYAKYVTMHFSNDEATNQWLMFNMKSEDTPWTEAYFESHVSNNHVAPATENIYNALMSLKQDDTVYLEGYLAESFGHQGDTRVVSSLSRMDILGGACECFYVTKAQIGDKVYK